MPGGSSIRINGFSIADDNGDDGKTIGIPSFLLIDHTVDPTGLKGPAPGRRFAPSGRTAGGTPYHAGRRARASTSSGSRFMVGTENIEPRGRAVLLRVHQRQAG